MLAWAGALLTMMVAALMLGISHPAFVGAQATDTGDRVVLVTLDGARTQEIFDGVDLAVLNTLPRAGKPLESHPLYLRYWAASAEQRRRKLMPFFWGTLIAQHGSIAGNRALGSSVSVLNTYRISFPGYSEMLVGAPHDDVIKTNDPVRNRFATVLEGVRQRLNLPANQVATFGSWARFNEIVEHREGATFVNAGPEPWGDDPDAATLAMLQRDAPPPWPDVRFDAVSMTYALRYLQRERPRLLYIAFDETDDWAHDGRYDRVLDAYARIDRYLEQLWTWLQSQDDYRGRTHLLIATDHGRGRTAADWTKHNATTDGADEVWLAFVSPSMPQRGEWRSHAPLTIGQVAATIAQWMGVDWRASNPRAAAAIR